MTTPVGGLGSMEMPRQKSASPQKFAATSVIKERRGTRSQVQVAQAAGVSQAFLSELENGRKTLTPDTAEKLAPAQLLLDEQLATDRNKQNPRRED